MTIFTSPPPSKEVSNTQVNAKSKTTLVISKKISTKKKSLTWLENSFWTMMNSITLSICWIMIQLRLRRKVSMSWIRLLCRDRRLRGSSRRTLWSSRGLIWISSRRLWRRKLLRKFSSLRSLNRFRRWDSNKTLSFAKQYQLNPI